MFLIAMIGAAAAAPDLVVERIEAGCTGTGGDPTIVLFVRNNGTSASGRFYVDVFRDEPAPPPIGSFGDQFWSFPAGLAAGARTTATFVFPGEVGWSGWVDALVDTDTLVTESNESNNHTDQLLTLPDCSFN
jgi:subtilase family serine protease